MKTFKLYFLFLSGMILLSSCKKEKYPESTAGVSAVFYFNGSVNNVPVNLQAGVNNYYMYTSYTQDANNVYNFIGNLKQSNCSNCINNLEVQINDYKVSAPNASVNIDSSVAGGSYVYYNGGLPTNFYQVQFTSIITNGPAQSYSWNFGDGGTSTLANPIHNYASMGTYVVCLTASTGTCSSSICDTVRLGVPNSTCHAAISASVVGNTVNFTATTIGGSTTKTYRWYFGDSTPDSILTSAPSHTYPASCLYTVKLKVVDSANVDSTYASYKVGTGGYSNCITNYNVSGVTPVTFTNTLGLANVIIKWTDANGVVYTSAGNSQPNASYFQILSEESHKNNENNVTTRKLHVKFSCELYSGAQSIFITNADAVIAVAYK